MIKGIFHINIVCREIQRSLDFYCGLLGAEIVATLGEGGLESKELAALMGFEGAASCIGHLLRFGEKGSPAAYTTIDLVQWIRPVVTGSAYDRLNHVGMTRICLPVDDIDATYERLREAGVDFLSPPIDIPVRLFTEEHSWFRMCCLRDPDGVILELSMPVQRK